MKTNKFLGVKKKADTSKSALVHQTPLLVRPYDRHLQIQVMQLKAELAAKTLILEKFIKIIREISSLINNSTLSDKEKKRYNALFRDLLTTNPEVQDDTLFALHRDTIHKLTTTFPNLTANNIKLCLLILKGLTTKEISDYLFVQSRSVKVARSRLRKKFSLSDNTSLFSFLRNL